MNFKAIILAAGKGTRMKSKNPKVVHKVCGKEMVNHVIDISNKSGVNDVVVILGHGSETVKNVIPEDAIVVMQTEQLGTGHAVKMAKDTINDDDIIVVLCGDTPLIEEETLQAIYNNAQIIKNISLERITDEFTKIILSDKPENIVYLFKTKLLKYLDISNEENKEKIEDLYKKIGLLNEIDKDLTKRLATLDYLIEALDINCKSFCNSLIYSKKIIKNHNIILNCLKNTNDQSNDQRDQ